MLIFHQKQLPSKAHPINVLVQLAVLGGSLLGTFLSEKVRLLYTFNTWPYILKYMTYIFIWTGSDSGKNYKHKQKTDISMLNPSIKYKSWRRPDELYIRSKTMKSLRELS